MKRLRRHTPTGSAIFCEDIRHELSGQMTMVGVFQGGIMLPPETSFPATIPRLGVYFKFIERPGESDADVRVRLYSPGFEEPLVDHLLEAPEDRHFIMERPPGIPPEDFDPTNSLEGSFVVSPFPLQREGHVIIRAVRGEEELSLGALHVVLDKAMAAPRA